jgi:hypothetical protein
MKIRMKKLFNYVAITVLATTLFSCEDVFADRDDRFDSASFVFKSTASLDLLEVADVEFTITDANGKVLKDKMETVEWKNSVVNVKSLPANAKLNIKVTLKDGYTPKEGEEFDFNFKVSYDVWVYDRSGEIDEDRKGRLYDITINDVESENLAESFKKIFPKEKVFSFSIDHEPRDKDDYLITIDELK